MMSLLWIAVNLCVAILPYMASSTDLCQDCPDKLDLAFVIDSSGSIQDQDDQNWQTTLDFVANVASGLHVGPDHVQVGVLSFSDHATVDICLDEYADVSSLVGAVHNLKHKGGNTNTGAAVKGLRDSMFLTDHGAREGVLWLGVILSDGFATLNLDSVFTEANATKRAGISLLSVGVTAQSHLYSLQQIASSPQYVLQAGDYEHLGTMVTPLLHMIGRVAQEVQVSTPRTTTASTTVTTTTTLKPTTTTTKATTPTTTTTTTATTPITTTETTTTTTTSPTTTTTASTTTTSKGDDKVGEDNVNTVIHKHEISVDAGTDETNGNSNPKTHVGSNTVMVVTGGHSNTTLIAVAVVGVILVIIICGAVLIVIKRRNKRDQPGVVMSPAAPAPPSVSWHTSPPPTAAPVPGPQQASVSQSNPAGDTFVIIDSPAKGADKSRAAEATDNAVNENMPPSYSAQ